MYLYPENLKARATLWLWNLTDLVWIGIFLALSLLCLSVFGQPIFLIASVLFAILTIGFRRRAFWILSGRPVIISLGSSFLYGGGRCVCSEKK